MNAKITFPDLVDLVAESTRSNRRVSELFLKELFATISQALIDGDNVTVKGLGTFRLARVAARDIVSVNTGERTQVPSHNKLVFEPDKKLADELNQPFAQFETIELDDDITDEMLGAEEQQPQADVLTDPEENAETDVEASAVDLPSAEAAVAPPPFRPAPVMMPAQHAEPEPEPEPVVVPEPEPEPEPVVVPEPEPEPEPVVEPEPEPEPEPVMVQEPESAPAQADVDETAQNLRRATFKGFLMGAASMLVLSLLVWWLAGTRSGQNSDALAAGADTVAQQQEEVDLTAASLETSEKAEAQAATPAPVAQVTDTVSPTNYLTKMAVKHYDRQEFWVYIYEENKDRIDNPNAVPPGTVLVIPPAGKYGIDATDKQSVDHAKKKSFELFSRFN